MRVLIAEDEKTIRSMLTLDLEDAGHQVVAAASGTDAQHELERENFDVVISDIRMPGIDGVTLLRNIKDRWPDTEVIMMTGVPTYETAVECIRIGAFDFITKPFRNDEVILKLEKLAEKNALQTENVHLRTQIDASFRFDNLIGRSHVMQQIFEEIRTIADSDVPVLLRGESGTGKELFAKAIHHNSSRRDQPFVTVACHLSAPTLPESMLFGHVKGAFTGADRDKLGKFEEADGGTIFLDDIDDIPVEAQPKLLRVLQEGEVERLGDPRVRQVDVRIIAATKVELQDLIAEGSFREDLYYRLNVLQIDIPPLRQRNEDVPLLVEHFIKRHSRGREIEIDDDSLALLQNYHFPGNVRELDGAVQAAMARCGSKGTLLRPEHFQRTLRSTGAIPANATRSERAQAVLDAGARVTLREVVEASEREHITRVMRSTSGNTTKAAELLGISRKSLWEKRNKYQIEI